MKKLLSVAVILVLILSLASCGKKELDVSTITEVRDFSNGFAWICNTTETGKKWSLIDTSGKVIYSSRHVQPDYRNVSDVCGNACYTFEYDPDSGNELYKIINTDGNVVASSENGEFDEILGCGDNLFFVHKYEGGIDSDRHLYGTINDKGEFVNPLKELINIGFEARRAEYAGAKMFYLMPSDPTARYGALFNANNGSVCSNAKIYPIDGANNNYISNIGSKVYFNNNSCVSSDGKIETVDDFDYVLNGLIIKTNIYTNEVSYFINPVSGETISFSKYPIEDIKPADNNFLLKLRGKDDNVYYTVIDNKCNILFEPVKGYDAEANDGKVVLKDEFGGYCVLDYSGNILIDFGTYSEINAFDSGVAWAVDYSNQYVGIDENGNVVIS